MFNERSLADILLKYERSEFRILLVFFNTFRKKIAQVRITIAFDMDRNKSALSDYFGRSRTPETSKLPRV